VPGTPPPVLSLPLLDVLSGMADRALSGRLRKVYLAAASAITRLSDIDLIKYETTVTDGSPDLSLWEEMAPVIRDTVVDVNALLTVIREQFPEPPPGGIAATLSQAIEEVGPLPGVSPEERHAREAEKAIHESSRHLSQHITHLGERMRSPSIVSDRWNLLAEIQAIRSKFRELIGDLVYLTASLFVEVHRKDVVPGYPDEVRASVLIRSTVTDLTRLLASRVEKVREAEGEDITWYAQQLEKDLDSFGRTPAYRALRAQDKRQIIEFRHAMGKLVPKESLSKDELIEPLKPFSAFIGSLSKVNNREVLIQHDREVWAACGVRLEQAENLCDLHPPEAAEILGQAVEEAQGLYGRDGNLDTFLRKVRKNPASASDPKAVRIELNLFRELLASLPLS
jgi:hypothetical protein